MDQRINRVALIGVSLIAWIMNATLAVPGAAAEDYEWIGNQTGPFSLPHNVSVWSFHEGVYWAEFKVPGIDYMDGDDDTDDVALLGTGYDPPGIEPPYQLAGGGTLYFGDFEHATNSSIDPIAEYEARDLVNFGLQIQSGEWIFDFAPFDGLGDNPDFDPVNSGSYTLTNHMVVGDAITNTGAPGEAELTIRNGTLATAFASLGPISDASGTVKVVGSDAKWTILNVETGFGDLHVGGSGTGELRVEQGGVVEVGGSASVALNPDSVGSVVVTGAGSRLSGLGGVGGSGHGSLTIASGGHVTSKNGDAFIGIDNNSFGEASVSGSGTSWTNIDFLTVGGVFHTVTTGHGVLHVSDGAFASSVWGVVAEGNSTGEIVVTGSDSRWTMAAHLLLGTGGHATLDVLEGATVEAGGDIAMAGSSTADAMATVSGVNSLLSATSALNVGQQGSAELLVRNDAFATAGNILRIGAMGSVDVSDSGRINIGSGTIADVPLNTLRVGPGGTLAGTGTIIGDVLVDGGTVNPGASPGSLRINGNYHQLSNGTMIMEIGGTAPGTQYDQLLVTGSVLLEGAVNISFIDGFLPQPGDAFDLFGGATVELAGPLNFLNPPPDFQYKSTFSNGLFSVAVEVPEPRTALLMACGLAGTFVSARHRSKRRNASPPWSPH